MPTSVGHASTPAADVAEGVRCPACHLPLDTDDAGDFCEHCGSTLTAPPDSRANLPVAGPVTPTPPPPPFEDAVITRGVETAPESQPESDPQPARETPSARVEAHDTGAEAVTASVAVAPEDSRGLSVAGNNGEGAAAAPSEKNTLPTGPAPTRDGRGGPEASAPPDATADKAVEPLPPVAHSPREELTSGLDEARPEWLRKWAVPGGVGLCVLLAAGAALLFWPHSRPEPPPITTPSATAPNTASADGAPAAAAAPPQGMVFVPGGSFRMGRDDGDEYERPAYTVSVRAFYLDAHEVTCEQYAKFVAETNRRPPPTWPGGRYDPASARLPVTGVGWDDAQAYALWAGARLPTEEEWEFAARGADGRLYPWGNLWQPDSANAAQSSAGRMTAVGSFPAGASPFGALDMVGNAWEWTASRLKAYPGGSLPEQRGKDLMVIRGNYWNGKATQATATFRRGYPARDEDYRNTGFRCARDVAAEGHGNARR